MTNEIGGVMITPDVLTEYVRRMMPDATVTVSDRTGTMNHLKVVVISAAFAGKNLLDRHRLIYQALDGPLKDGRIHALEITAKTTDETLGGRAMADPIQEEINKEVATHKILIYGKGTKQMPMCGFTRETMQFFDKYGYPYELIDVLSQPAKREALVKNDQLADASQGVHRRAVLRRHRYPRSDGSQRRDRAAAEKSVRKVRRIRRARATVMLFCSRNARPPKALVGRAQ